MIRHKINKRGNLVVIYKEKYGISLKFDRKRPIQEQVAEAVEKIKIARGL